MAIQSHLKAYTIVDLKVATLSGDVPGTLVDVPGVQAMNVTLTNDTQELRGDNKTIAIVDKGTGLEWSFEQGGLSLDAMVVIFGLSYTDSGTTPNIKRQWNVKSSDTRPYFFVCGKAISDDGTQDLQVSVWKAKATDNVEFALKDGEFLLPKFGGIAIGRSADDRIMSFLQHETAAAIEVPA